MPILDLQKRSRELGRIRLGQKGAKGQPQKLETFRFTTNSETLIRKVAELYGGEPNPWEGGTQRFELISDAISVPIMIPRQPVSQWHEAWRGGGVCIHRCDGQTNAKTGEPCDPEDPVHIEAIEKPTTRLNVMLSDVEVGLWRVESHGWNAATELPDLAEFLAAANGYVTGRLGLDPRQSVDTSGSKPVTRKFSVPIIEIDVTPAQLMAGHGRVAAPPMIGGPAGHTPALAAAGPDYVALAADLTDPEAVRDLWRQANAAGHMTQGLSEHLQKRVAEIEASQTAGGRGEGEAAADRAAASSPTPPDPEPDADGVVDAELVDDPDPDQVWAQIVQAAAAHGLSRLPDLEQDVETFLGGTSSAEASGSELQEYLDDLGKRPTEQAS